MKTARHSQLSTLNSPFKQTEVGVIPEDWEVSKLGKHATFKTGPFGSVLHKSDYVDGGVPVINPMQIVDGKIQPTPSMAVTEEAAQKLSDFRLSAGNIVIGRRGEMGRCAFVLPEQHGWLCGTGSMIVRTGPSLDGRFIQRMLSSPPVIAAIKNASVGSTMINLNQGTLGNLLIPFPLTKAEQEAIAEALSDADALIESLEQLITKKHQIKQGAMQELLTGKKRLPGFATKPGYKQTEVGVIPEDWEVRPLEQLGPWRGGATPSMQNSAFWANGTIPWVSSGDVKSVSISDAPMKITDYAVRNSSTTVLPTDSIIIVVRSGILRKYLPVSQNTCPLAINQDIKALIPAANLVPSYLLYLLTWSGPKILATCLKSGTTVESLEFRWLKSFRIPLPPSFAEQEAIAAILSDMGAEIAALEEKLAKARQLKQGMMQELLTGRIRLV